MKHLFLIIAFSLACGPEGNDKEDNNDELTSPINNGNANNTPNNGANSTSNNGANSTPNNGANNVAQCVEFSTGETFTDGDQFYAKCDGFPPQNCPQGTFMWFGGSEDNCFCALKCEDFNTPKQLGEACDNDGQTVCTYVENSTKTSSGNWCLPKAWVDLDLDCSE